MSTRSRWSLLIAILAPAFLATAASAQQADVIRGRVTGPDSLPLEGASVTATAIGTTVSQTRRTDRNGRYTITFPDGEGDYMISVTAVGHSPRRFQIKRVADEEILVADARLQMAAQRMEAVNVRGQRDRVNRNDPGSDVSGTDRGVNPGTVDPGILGDLAAMAGTLPGVQFIPAGDASGGGFSVLGLDPSANALTMNGMNFGGSNLPRDATVSTSLGTSPWDVSRGNFSGASMSVRTFPGSNFSYRRLSVNAVPQQTQLMDRTARATGAAYQNVSVGGSASGPISFDRAFYNTSFQYDRNSRDLQTLLGLDPFGLRAAGLAGDSLSRLLGILGGSGIPTTVAGLPDNALRESGSALASIDIRPPSSVAGHMFNIVGNAAWSRSTPQNMLGEVPAHGAENGSWNATLQGRHNAYFGFGVLTETSLAAYTSRSRTDPYLALPNASVRINSTFDDGTASLRNIAFGGNPAGSSDAAQTTVGYMNTLSWFSASNAHRIKFTSELRRESYTQQMTANGLGTFTYNSLADLENGRPASYSRMLSARERTMAQYVGGVSLGDSWRRTPNLQVQYGVRVDGNVFGTTPARNAAVAEVFGRDNAELPERFYVSPRLGFSWTYGANPQISSFEGAFRGPRAALRGGVGVFQSTPQTTILGSAIDNTGLPSGTQQVSCVGAATPIPDWDRYAIDRAAVPDRCADGTTGTVFSNALPNVNLFDPAWAASRSIRANLSWSGMTLGNRFITGIDATIARNVNQPGMVDLNFAPSAQFTLANEGGRPVYVRPGSIVPPTGAIASRDARVSDRFNRVLESRSDLESESRQVTVRVSPFAFNSRFSWNASYTLASTRDLARGFGSGFGGANTDGNPLERSWGRSSFDSRHQITYSVGYDFFNTVRVNWSGSFRSGNPYTPMIGGDVNGDGYGNDRAFIPDPAAVTDPALASGLRALLDNGSESARECLAGQLGRMAGRNSCNGPWQSQAFLSLTLNATKVRMPPRTQVSFSLSNPLAAADMLLHGDKIRGWGQSTPIDNQLLYVRGFDPATNRYRYEVNERFGSTNPAFNVSRTPVTLTAQLRFDVGPAEMKQRLSQDLSRGRTRGGTKLAEPSIRQMYSRTSLPNPMATILAQADSLRLTTVQADSIAAMNRRFTLKVDSLWAPTAQFLAALPDRFDEDEAFARYRATEKAAYDVMIGLAPYIRGLLTREQQRRLPSFIASYLDERFLLARRNGAVTGGGPMVMMGGGAMPAMAGGGATQVIIHR